MNTSVHISRIKGVLFYLLAFILPCDIYATPVVILAYTIAWVFEGRLREKFTNALHNKFVILFCAFYLMHLLSMLYSSNTSMGWFELEVKSSLFIFPLMMALEGKMPYDRQKKFMFLFIAGLVLNGIICIGVALWRLWAKNEFIFQYKEFSLFLHPSYYSMYIDTAIVFMFYLFSEKDALLNRREKIFLYSSLFFLVFMLVLLQSKTGLIVSLIVFTIIIVRYALKKRAWITVMLMLAGGFAAYIIPYHYIVTSGRSRIISAEEILTRDTLHASSTESNQVRLFIWNSAWKVVKEHPLAGTGNGAVEDALMKQYTKDGVTGALREKLNAHDEYIQCTLALGFPGLLVLLACLLWPFYKSLKERKFVYTMFLLILMINFLTEAMFQTQGGTMFYGLFNSLLMFNFVI